MLIPLSKVKIGDEVAFKWVGVTDIRGHVVARDNDIVIVAWEKGVAAKENYSHWAIGTERKKFPNIPAKYTDGWYWHAEQLVEVVSKKTNNVGFLAMCIAAGAGMSTYASKSNGKKVSNLNLKTSRI